jgi:hypothetical protein
LTAADDPTHFHPYLYAERNNNNMEAVADVEKLLLAVQLQFVQGFGVRLAPKAVELLTMDANDRAQITPQAQNGAKEIVEIGEGVASGPRPRPSG